jgi:hypothetical protein
MTVVIPVAGLGYRLKSMGCKALLSLTPSPETILARTVRMVRARWPGVRLVIVVGFEARKVRRALKKVPNATIVENPDYATTNTAHSLRLAFQNIDGPALVVYGDLVFSEGALGELCVDGGSRLYGEGSLLRSDEVGLSVDERGSVGGLCHGLPVRWAHVAYLEEREMRLFDRAMTEAETPSSRFLAYEVFNRVIERGGHFRYGAWPSAPHWLVEVDTSKDVGAARLAVRLEMESSCA